MESLLSLLRTHWDHEPDRHPSPCPLPARRGEGGRRPGEGRFMEREQLSMLAERSTRHSPSPRTPLTPPSPPPRGRGCPKGGGGGGSWSQCLRKTKGDTPQCDRSERSDLAAKRRMTLPLPEGEGWGEGEGDARSANRVGTSPEVGK